LNIAHSYYLNLEATAGLVTPKWVLTNKATLNDKFEPVEDAWRKKTSAVLRRKFILLNKLLSIDNLIEIGAHEASVSCELFSIVNKKCYAVEANPFVFNKYVNTFYVPINYENLAISKINGNVELHIPKFSETLDRADTSLLNRASEADYKKVNVNSSTLKDFILKKKIQNDKNSCWLDAEGLSYDILESGENLIESLQIALIEVEDISYWENQHLVLDVIQICLNFNLIPICRDLDGRGQYNVLFVKNNLVEKCGGVISDFWQELNSIKINTEIKSRKFWKRF